MIITDKKKTAEIILSKRHAEGGEVSHPAKAEGSFEDDGGLTSAAEDVLQAIHDKSHIDLAKSLKAFFELADSLPHEEGGMEDGGLEEQHEG